MAASRRSAKRRVLELGLYVVACTAIVIEFTVLSEEARLGLVDSTLTDALNWTTSAPVEPVALLRHVRFPDGRSALLTEAAWYELFEADPTSAPVTRSVLSWVRLGPRWRGVLSGEWREVGYLVTEEVYLGGARIDERLWRDSYQRLVAPVTGSDPSSDESSHWVSLRRDDLRRSENRTWRALLTRPQPVLAVANARTVRSLVLLTAVGALTLMMTRAPGRVKSLVRCLRARSRRRRNACIGCGYSLVGARASRCPECGEPIEAQRSTIVSPAPSRHGPADRHGETMPSRTA